MKLTILNIALVGCCYIITEQKDIACISNANVDNTTTIEEIYENLGEENAENTGKKIRQPVMEFISSTNHTFYALDRLSIKIVQIRLIDTSGSTKNA